MLQLTTQLKKWFKFPQDESGEAQVQILHLKPGKVTEIEEKANQIIGRKQGDEFVTEIESNPGCRRRAFLDAAILDWKGFSDKKGKKLACTEFNKLKVAQEFDWFFEQIEDFREALADEAESEEEGAEKN